MNQLGDELDPQLQSAIDQLKQMPPRDPQAADRGRVQFLARANSLARQRARPSDGRSIGGWALLPRRIVFTSALACALVLVLLVGGTAVTAYAAQDSLPDAPLYPVKLMAEDAQASVAFRPEDKLGLYLTFADRRVAEIAALSARQVVVPNSVVDRLEEELNTALALAADMPDEGQGRALTRMQATVQRQQQTITRVYGSAPLPAKPAFARVEAALANHRSLVEMGLADPSGLRQEIRRAGNRATPPGQERRATTVPPGLEQRPGAPGQEQHPGSPPGQRQPPGNGAPGTVLAVSPTPTLPGQHPFATPTLRIPGDGKGNESGRKP